MKTQAALTDTLQPTAPKVVSCGRHIDAMAAHAGLPPADVALCIASVLSGIAGPYAGLVDSTGGRVRTHLSLLRTGRATPRLQALEDRLFQPLRKRADRLRQRASSSSRTLLDRHVFGAHASARRKASPIPDWLHESEISAGERQEHLVKDLGFPHDQFSEKELMSRLYYAGRNGDPVRTSPGAAHLPSFFFDKLPLEQLPAALNESIHREALLIHPGGEPFERMYKRTPGHDGKPYELISLLQGADRQYTPLHRDQGPGTFEHSRVHLWASISMEHLAETLADHSPWSEMYNHCLLWEESACQAPKVNLYELGQAWQKYDELIHELLNLRCFGQIQHQKRLPIPAHYEPRFNHIQEQYWQQLEKIQSADNSYTAHFHDLPARLLWVFLQFYQEGEPFWCGKAAFHVALYAARKHARLLGQAHDLYNNLKMQPTMEKIIAVIHSKGPCKQRVIQRSTNKLSAAHLRPVIQMMKRNGVLQADEQKRYRLVQASS
jgi:hypothetical protein